MLVMFLSVRSNHCLCCAWSGKNNMSLKQLMLTNMIDCVDNLDTLESDLRAAFAAHGSVAKVQMPTDRNTVSILTSLNIDQ